MEQDKRVEKCKKLPAVLKTVLGLILLGIGIILSLHWKKNILFIIKGCIGPFFVLIGAVTLAIAKD